MLWDRCSSGRSICWLLAQTPKVYHTCELTLVFAELATFAAYAVIPLLILYFLAAEARPFFARLVSCCWPI